MFIFHWMADVLRTNPELAIFLSLAVGYWIGSIKFGSFSLGAVTGTLLAGIIVGQLGIDISSQVKSVFFIMFLFAVGFGVGPQFVSGVTSDGIPQALFAVVISILCLLSVYVVSLVAGYGPGLSAGLLAGTQTISASIGLATDAINKSGLSPTQIKSELNIIPVSYAITYLFGTVGTGWIITFLGPKILNINLEKECKRYEKEMAIGTPEEGLKSAWLKYIFRSFMVESESYFFGKSVGEIEEEDEKKGIIFVENIKRDNEFIRFDDNEVIKKGDIIVLSGSHELLISVTSDENEVSDPSLLDIPVEFLDVLITNKHIAGKTILHLSKNPAAKGVFVTKIRRGANGVEIPIKAQTKLYKGDILSLVGSKKHIDSAVSKLGYPDKKTSATSMIFVGAGIVIGGVLGSIVIPIDGIPITLSTSGGALVCGLIFGWLHSFIPKLGSVPSATLWFMNSVGLNVFIAVVGITAGPTFIDGLKQAGVGIFISGLIATSVPMILAPLIGKYIFKFDPAINLGCCGGARTSTASVAMVADVAKSNVPMLGYTVPYAVSNTLLTIWGLAIILLI